MVGLSLGTTWQNLTAYHTTHPALPPLCRNYAIHAAPYPCPTRDTGNLYRQTLRMVPAPGHGYYQGRFSDGLVRAVTVA